MSCMSSCHRSNPVWRVYMTSYLFSHSPLKSLGILALLLSLVNFTYSLQHLLYIFNFMEHLEFPWNTRAREVFTFRLQMCSPIMLWCWVFFFHPAEAGSCWLFTMTKTSNSSKGQDLHVKWSGFQSYFESGQNVVYKLIFVPIYCVKQKWLEIMCLWFYRFHLWGDCVLETQHLDVEEPTLL